MHKVTFSFIIFGLFSLFLFVINFPFQSFLLSSLFSWLWIVFGVYIVYLLYKNRNVLLSLFLLLNIIVEIYFLFVYFYFDKINAIGPFDFSVFKLEYIQEAANVLFLVFSVMMLIWSLKIKSILLTKKINLKDKLDQLLLPIKKIKTSKIVYFLLFLFFINMLVYFGTATIFEAPYPRNQDIGFIALPYSIRTFLVLPFLIGYFIFKVKDNFQNTLRVIGFRVIFFIVLFCILLLTGSRGAATGLVMLLLFLDLSTDKNFYIRIINFGVASILLYIMIFVWPNMRSQIFFIGFFEAFLSAWQNIHTLQIDFFLTQFIIIPMIPQTLFHFLYVVSLLHQGVDLQYQTFINLIPQQMPQFMESLFGDRPLNDNLLLLKYYFHGGGFYIFANAYWNGGLFPLMLFTGAVAWLLSKIEEFFKNAKDPIYLIAYPVFAVLLPVNIFYGIQPFVRGLEFGFVILFTIYIFKKIRLRKR